MHALLVRGESLGTVKKALLNKCLENHCESGDIVVKDILAHCYELWSNKRKLQLILFRILEGKILGLKVMQHQINNKRVVPILKLLLLKGYRSFSLTIWYISGWNKSSWTCLSVLKEVLFAIDVSLIIKVAFCNNEFGLYFYIFI